MPRRPLMSKIHDVTALAARAVVGVVLIAHGPPKAADAGGTAAGFDAMGIPAPEVAALVGAVTPEQAHGASSPLTHKRQVRSATAGARCVAPGPKAPCAFRAVGSLAVLTRSLDAGAHAAPRTGSREPAPCP